ncbi:hypothetical protein TNCT1_46990 [Streptomyces sp. 1-11]|nr:hypothetical protein TNCT1_46990 [Streptomyces sp. 1-11]
MTGCGVRARGPSSGGSRACCVFGPGARVRGPAGTRHTLWAGVGVERMKAFPFQCQLVGVFRSGQQLGTSAVE